MSQTRWWNWWYLQMAFGVAASLAAVVNSWGSVVDR